MPAPPGNRRGAPLRTPGMRPSSTNLRTTPRPRQGAPGRRWPAVLLTVVASGLALLGPGALPAAAHDEPVASVPAPDATVPAPDRVELQLSAPPQPLGTRVTVTAPDGTAVAAGEPELQGSAVRQPLRPDLPAGSYTVSWQVTSSDGHPLTGTFGFVVVAPPVVPLDSTPAPEAAAPAPPAADTGAPAPGTAAAPQPASGSGVPSAWLAGGGLLAAAAVLGARSLRRRP